ncbi:MAG: hypothetical protein K1X51_13235 [Rhodospirillaceae bacterium]|nr:hypothetical protein [Rhodospirillaceae bacterium]
MKKRGRRHCGGRPKLNRPAIDTGTPELTARRLAIAPGNATLATAPLDALKARGAEAISDEAYAAACYFAALRKLVFGKAHPRALDLTAVSRGGLPEELDVAGAERKYRDACNYVRGQSRQAFEALENLVVHERWPDWMFAGRGKREPGQRHFEVGAAALLAWYRGRRV